MEWSSNLKCKQIVFFVFILIFMPFFAISGERTIPVDMLLMIDKSLSMAEEGRFEDLHSWLVSHFANQILIEGDWVALYQFYEKPEKLLELTIQNQDDIKKIEQTVKSIRPDGAFTDIGLALDTINEAIQPRLNNDRYKIMLLLTDLKQEAPWTSRYAGVQEEYESPYLIQARIIEHKNWFEITLDMDIKDQVIETTKELYSSIKRAGSSSIQEGQNLSTLQDLGSSKEFANYQDDQNPIQDSRLQNDSTHKKDTFKHDSEAKEHQTISLSLVIVLVSLVILIIVILVLFVFIRKYREDQEEKRSIKKLS